MHPSFDKYNSLIYSIGSVLVELRLGLEIQSLSGQSTIATLFFKTKCSIVILSAYIYQKHVTREIE